MIIYVNFFKLLDRKRKERIHFLLIYLLISFVISLDDHTNLILMAVQEKDVDEQAEQNDSLHTSTVGLDPGNLQKITWISWIYTNNLFLHHTHTHKVGYITFIKYFKIFNLDYRNMFDFIIIL